ncbi:aldo/keto reductase [Paraflavitalea sp. CAU 1676]|uniref:aldo/keto reductase n=1 Tax=Paraflavitalea sp. CAU 1676 TaxID=3032598 RepID=UPI0023DA8501|nr:aldo/keto reductase [Paraflavitalea sp. CAU 1676]MDF2190095.1 aldo/keto reductase [Paraflavitalea sp. CAU 1676]
MEYRQLGETNLQLSAITFGAWAIGGWMWGGADRKDALKAIQASYEAGVTSIDTAPAYGQGLSEEIVAEATQSIPRDKVQLLTKFGLRWDVKEGEFFFKSKDNAGNEIDMYKLASKASVIKECEDCLRRLKTDYIDLFQIHWADATTPIAETMEALALLKQQGKIREAGVCNYSVEQMKEAAKTFSLASDQVPYSMVFRDIEKELVPYILEHKKSIIAYSPLQRGLLTGKIKPGHQFNEGDTREGNRFYTEENIIKVNAFLDTLKPLAETKQASLAQLVLRWTIEQPAITVALAGARNAEQAVQNARAIEVKLSKEEIGFINKQIATLL